MTSIGELSSRRPSNGPARADRTYVIALRTHAYRLDRGRHLLGGKCMPEVSTQALRCARPASGHGRGSSHVPAGGLVNPPPRRRASGDGDEPEGPLVRNDRHGNSRRGATTASPDPKRRGQRAAGLRRSRVVPAADRSPCASSSPAGAHQCPGSSRHGHVARLAGRLRLSRLPSPGIVVGRAGLHGLRRPVRRGGGLSLARVRPRHRLPHQVAQRCCVLPGLVHAAAPAHAVALVPRAPPHRHDRGGARP